MPASGSGAASGLISLPVYSSYYPTPIQLAVRLVAAGILSNPEVSPEDLLDLGAACLAAAQSWEDLTGYTPFLAETVDSTHYFDGDGSNIVDLQGGFVSITSLSLNGTVRTLNTDFRYMPMNALTNGKPVTYLKWGGGYGRPFPAYYGNAGAVAVTGKRGAYAVLPQLALEGIFAIATSSLMGTFEYSKFGGIRSWTVGSDKEDYDIHAYERLAAWSERTIKNAVKAFKREKIA